jgi:hypothetical protein
MGIFEWGERRFARGIAKAMLRSYMSFKQKGQNINEVDLVKLALSTRSGQPAKQLLEDMDEHDFWVNVVGSDFSQVIFLLVRMEYIEYMNGSLNAEDEVTNSIFREVIIEEITKSGL